MEPVTIRDRRPAVKYGVAMICRTRRGHASLPVMDNFARKKTIRMALIVAVALALPLALAVVGGWRMWSDYRARSEMQTAYNEALKQSLERAADVAMPVPTLTDDVVALDVPADKFETELQRVVRLAHGIGGSASSWNDGTTVRIVASVPSTSASIFRDAVKSNVVSMAAAGESDSMTIVQIVLRPVAKK